MDPGPFLCARYLEVAEDGVEEIAAALRLVAEARDGLVFHCASGKDRTGQLAALVLALLGVPDETIVEDYTLTELASRALLDDWRARNDGRTPCGRASAAPPRP